MSRHHRRVGWGGSRVTRARVLWTGRIAEAAAHRRPVLCAQCGQPVLPGQPFDLGHEVNLSEGGDATAFRPEHRGCNRAAGARLSNSNAPRTRRWL